MEHSNNIFGAYFSATLPKMNSLQAKLNSDTLEHLKLLEGKLSNDIQHQSEFLSAQEEVEKLSDSVQALTKRKLELVQKLHQCPSDSSNVSPLSVSERHELVQKAASLEKEHRHECLISAHRCAGITAEIVGRGMLRVRFDTCYRGEYFEHFYLELEFRAKEVKAVWHTIPMFVPLKRILERHNGRELTFLVMLNLVHSYLSAFVKRRQQAIEFSVRHKDYLKEDIAALYAYNTIQLVLEIPIEEDSFQLVVQLYYKDLCSFLPSTVKCSDTASLPISRARIKETFMSLPIAGAFQNLFLDQNIEQG